MTMAYNDYLASRGYQRAVFVPTKKRAGDFEVVDANKPAVEVAPVERKVVEMKRKAAK
jgi:hypothetical protein